MTGFRIPDAIPEVLPTPENNRVVSVVIPSYNMASTVGKAIQSILMQTYPHKEIIVVDDGSEDNTEQVVRAFPEAQYIKQPNLNTANALNRGIKASAGQYVAWLSADDYYTDPDAITKRVVALQRDDSIDFAHSYFTDVFGDTKILHSDIPSFQTKEEAYEANKQTCLINGSTLLMRRSVFHNIGTFNYCYRYLQDYEFYFRLLKNHKGALVPESLLERTNEVNMLGQEVQGNGRALWEAEKQRTFEYSRVLDQPRPSICAMICMKNEDQCIEACLDDLVQWVDKIVVFNDGSTDNSPARVRKYAKVVDVYDSPPKGNIRTEGQDRQKLLEMAQAQGTDWLLFVDTDEVFEHSIKWKLFDLLADPQVNLYSFLEVNFWRCLTQYRVDELFYKGWFGRLFRSSPGLRIADRDEHCGGIPENIPECQMWKDGGKHRRSPIRVKHYGFAYWDKTIGRYMRRMERDPYNPETNRGGWAYYERMIDETGLQLAPYEGDSVGAYLHNQSRM